MSGRIGSEKGKENTGLFYSITYVCTLRTLSSSTCEISFEGYLPPNELAHFVRSCTLRETLGYLEVVLRPGIGDISAAILQAYGPVAGVVVKLLNSFSTLPGVHGCGSCGSRDRVCIRGIQPYQGQILGRSHQNMPNGFARVWPTQ